MENLVMTLAEVYKGKKVFVTGHTGFKGSWLISWLHLLGAEIKGYALAPTGSLDLYTVIKGDNLCQSIIADIRDAAKLKEEVIAFQPDFVFHLAAQPLVRLSYEIASETFDVNAMGTANMLEAIKALTKPCVALMVTTDKVYHNIEQQYFYKEDDKLGGYDPYSASKACAELVISSYRSSFFNPAAYSNHQKSISVARAGNVIGGGDQAKDRIIPDIVRALSSSKEIEVRNPKAVRPWQHVLEPLHGYLLLAAKQVEDPVQFSDAYNFGPLPQDNLTVKDIVETAIGIWGEGRYAEQQNIHAPHEAGLLQLDIQKAMNGLGWLPQLTAKEAIAKTIGWYREFYGQPSIAFAITMKDIASYTALLSNH